MKKQQQEQDVNCIFVLFNAQYDDNGERICTCGSELPWYECGYTEWCG